MSVTANLVADFEAQAGRIGASVHCVSRVDLVREVTRLLQEAGCRDFAVARAVPEREQLLAGLREAGFVEVEPEALWPTNRADAGVVAAKLGVAESGSVLLHADSSDRRVELCVDIQVVLLDAARLVPTLDQAFVALREIAAHPPAYASLVSGPSRSADIERTLTIGVHGPRALHILLVEDGA